MTTGPLAPCPSSPNCVSSDDPRTSHRVEALRLKTSPEPAWDAIRKAVASMPRTTIVESGPEILRAECRSAIFRFVDDLELRLRPAERTVAVRSASRIGWSDIGVNRRRVERLRAALVEIGVVEGARAGR